MMNYAELYEKKDNIIGEALQNYQKQTNELTSSLNLRLIHKQPPQKYQQEDQHELQIAATENNEPRQSLHMPPEPVT